ncbi:PREDICTED: uncharacterized protein LOC104727985 [Camelina sativa]|uniref:Uncharacterized protein LOC104727985 n=1 Tax=Camelina sativa TaxID=90675 RepID=A0ABM0US39_CAMSA|nr:PREDICTED: uncharacterized protein LOC104727985 [Camelina sativa]
MIIRRRRNRIESLKNNAGVWISAIEELEDLAIAYYQRLYSLVDVDVVVESLPQVGFPSLTVMEKNSLARPYTEAEVESAVKGMGKFKAPSPDGYQPVFYQECWDIVGMSVTHFVLEFFATNTLPEGTNDALDPTIETGNDHSYRPCSVELHSGRLSTDNILVVQEAVHSMRRKKGHKGWMFTRELEELDNVMCYESVFDTIMEWLCHLIEFSTTAKEWKPICLSRNGPKLSHICFANDIILFVEASVAQIRVIRRVLERFCVASGQKVSLEKSKIFYSENVSRDLAQQISTESGIKATRELGKYMGMHVLHKRINKDTFGEVLERVASRLSGWRGRFLSLAGRVTLTKAVLSFIPVHTMSTILLPQSALEKLDRLSRSFLWGSTTDKHKQYLLAWDCVYLPKLAGGLGIRSAKQMNVALLAKVGWQLLHDKVSIWARVLRSKYKVGDIRDGTWLVAKSSWSSTWRSVGRGLREGVAPCISWVLGDGRSVRFWKECWLTNSPLCDLLEREQPAGYDSVTVRDLWKSDSG